MLQWQQECIDYNIKVKERLIIYCKDIIVNNKN